MSVEARKIKGRTYVTETQRVDGRVCKKHIGPLTDPAVELIYRQARLAKAERTADLRTREEERSVDTVLEEQMDLLAHFAIWSDRITTLLKRCGRTPGFDEISRTNKRSNKQTLLEQMNRSPKARELQRLCRLADQGDVAAKTKLNHVIANSREIVRAMFDPIAAARKSVVSSIAGSQYLLSRSVEEGIDRRIREILASAADDPIAKMRAEIAVIAWLDALRCGVAATRQTERQCDGKYAQALADRSLRRFERAARSVQKHDHPASKDL